MAIILLLIADPGTPMAQLAFYAAASAAAFFSGLAAVCQRASRGGVMDPPWRDGVYVGLAMAGAAGLAFAGLRLGLGVYWPVPPALLLAGLAIAGIRNRRA